MPRMPNPARLKPPRSHLVRVCILAQRGQDYFREIILGVSAVAASRGWMVPVVDYPSQLTWLEDEPYDVLVFTGVSWSLVPSRLKRGRVLVAADVDLLDHGVPSVVIDNYAIGRSAAHYLIERGFTSFASFGLATFSWAMERARGFREALSGTGLHLREWVNTGHDPDLAQAEWSAAERVLPWLRSLRKPVALFAACDGWGSLIADYCRIAGLRVPEDMAIVGVDNDEFVCQLAVPPLSSVATPLRRLGTEVGLMIDRLLGGRELEQRKVVLQPTGVVTRRSSDVLAVDDPDVAAVLAFIRDHADSPLSVSDILQHVPAYQHRLERGFKRYLGRTMTDEIRRVHVEQAKQLLAGTDLPMYEVAERSGFTNQAKLAIAFKRETSMTPTDYRRRFRPPIEGLVSRQP